MRDMYFDFLPQHSFAKQILWSGRMPLWSSHSGFGKPFAADPQTATFYPLHAAFYLFSAPTALRIYGMAHLWLAGAGMFALARHWRIGVSAALLTAISCMFSSWLVANLEFANNLAAAVWAPLIMLTTSRVLETLEQRDVPAKATRLARLTVVLGLLFGVQYLAGFPEFVVYTSVLAATYVIAVCTYQRAFRQLIIALALFAAAAGIAMLLTAPQLLLSMQFVPLSERGATIDPRLNMASFQLHNLWQFILPFINGRPGYPDQFWAGTVFEFWIGTCYVGILPLLLAGFSVLVFRRGRSRRDHKFLCLFLVGALCFAILMALGKNTPLYPFLQRNVPGFAHFRFPSKFLVLVLFALSMLAGLGWQQILDICSLKEGAQRFRRVIVILSSVVVAVFVCGYSFALSNSRFFQILTGGLFPVSKDAYRVELSDSLLAIILLTGSLGVVLALAILRARWLRCLGPALTFANLFVVTAGLHPIVGEGTYETKPPVTLNRVTHLADWRVHSIYGWVQQWLYANRDESLIKWSADAGVGDSWLPFGINQTSQGGQKLSRYVILYSLLGSLPQPQADKLADLLSIRYILTGPAFQEIYWRGGSRALQLTERQSALPRAFVVPNWIGVRRVDDSNQAVSEILGKTFQPDFDVARTAIVEATAAGGNETDIPFPESTMPDSGNAGEVHSFQDNGDEISARVLVKRQSLFVLNDAWYPGWTAEVDGAAQSIFRTNFHFRGVFINPGEHEVRFLFAPQQFCIGLWITLSTVVLIVAFFGVLPHLLKTQQVKEKGVIPQRRK